MRVQAVVPHALFADEWFAGNLRDGGYCFAGKDDEPVTDCPFSESSRLATPQLVLDAR
jgi:hypothetical protein